MNYEISDIVKENLKSLMEERNYNIHSLANNCGLHASALRMLYTGATKSPSLETLYKLAEFFNVSLDELTGRKKFVGSSQKKDFQWNTKIFKEVSDIVLQHIEVQNYQTSLNQSISILKEAYIFVLTTNNGQVEDKVIQWVVDKNLDTELI